MYTTLCNACFLHKLNFLKTKYYEFNNNVDLNKVVTELYFEKTTKNE